MNRSELIEQLRGAGVPDALYEIPGIHEVPGQPDAYYFLRHGADAWVVGLRQRSRDGVMERFDTEADACEYLYRKITELPPPEPAGPLENLLAHTEEIQRRAWQDFERAPHEGDGNGTGRRSGHD